MGFMKRSLHGPTTYHGSWFVFVRFNQLFDCYKTNVGPLTRSQPHSPNVISQRIFKIRSQSLTEPINEIWISNLSIQSLRTTVPLPYVCSSDEHMNCCWKIFCIKLPMFSVNLWTNSGLKLACLQYFKGTFLRYRFSH